MTKKIRIASLLFLLALIIGCGNKTLPTSPYSNLNLSNKIFLYSVEDGFFIENIHKDQTLYIVKSENGGEEMILDEKIPPLGSYTDRDVKQGSKYSYTLKYGNLYSKQYSKVFSRPINLSHASIEELHEKMVISFNKDAYLKYVNVYINGDYVLSAKNNRIYIDESLESVSIVELQPVDIYGNAGVLYPFRFNEFKEEGFEYIKIRGVKNNTLVVEWSYIGDAKSYELKLLKGNTTLYKGYSNSYISSIDIPVEEYDCLTLSIKPLKPDDSEGKIGFIEYCKE